jgi:hypothetical protein
MVFLNAVFLSNAETPSGSIIEESDSIVDYTNLEEFTIEAKNKYSNGTSTIYVPSKKEREASSGGFTLLQNLSIAELNIDPVGKEVKYANNEVKYFINFNPATLEDVENIMTDDVKKVEFLCYSTDPRIRGEKFAINFTLKKHQYGGYTKVDLDQSFRNNNGDYRVNSKLEYNNLTFDIWASYKYSSTHHKYTDEVGKYLIHDKYITRHESPLIGTEHSQTTAVTGRVIYSMDSLMITNKVGGVFNNMPHRNLYGNLSFSPDIYASADFSSISNSKSSGVEWTGNYYIPLKQLFALSLDPQVTFYRSYSNYRYLPQAASEIITNTKEDYLNGIFSGELSRRISNHKLGLVVSYQHILNRTHYAGTTIQQTNLSESVGGVHLNANLQFSSVNWYMWASLLHVTNKQDDESHKYLSPKAYTSVYWRISDQHRFTVSFDYSQMIPLLSTSNTTLVLLNELEAMCGNPNIKPVDVLNGNLTYNYLINQKFSLSISELVSAELNPWAYNWEQGDFDGKEVLIRSFINQGKLINPQTDLSFTARLFKNHLVAKLTGSYNYIKRTGDTGFKYSKFSFAGSLQGYVGPIQLQVYYATRKNQLRYFYVTNGKNYLDFKVNWMHKGLLLSAYIKNPFTSSRKAVSYVVNSPMADFSNINYDNTYSRSFGISLTYTFRYGKKSNVEQEVLGISEQQSAIL